MAKTVGIIGAGPSGLVAAKTLLHDAPPGSFEVTLFEAQPRVGGLWPARPDDSDGLVHPLMVANQSRHTVQFSSLAWDPENPEFPRAWQVGQYLARYADRYCHRAEIKLGWRVVSAAPETVPSGGGVLPTTTSWNVRAESAAAGKTEDRLFDHLVVASGFFGRPVWPPEAHATVAGVPAAHSSQYRNIETLLGRSPSGDGNKILVVGGQMSGVEIAGTIASHLSSAVNSPDPSPVPDIDKYSVEHLIQRPLWIFPLHISPQPDSPSPPFVPLDLSSYDISKRPSPLINTQGHITPEAARTANSIFKAALGTNQSEFSRLLAVGFEAEEEPPYLAVSDPYTEFVRSGLINLSAGKLDRLDGRTAVITTPTPSINTSSTSHHTIDGVAAVIYATGFEAASSLSFLPVSVRNTLGLHPTDLSNTVALAFHDTHHPAVPNLGFVGFYRSPYWGVMEMQARLLASLWLAGGPASPSLPTPLAAALAADRSLQRSLALRIDPRASQFPMGDYPFLMQEFSAALGLPRRPNPLATVSSDVSLLRSPAAGRPQPMDILTPARYSAVPEGMKEDDKGEAAEVRASLLDTQQTALAALTRGQFAARAIFRALQGHWHLERDLRSRLPAYPSGHFSGVAQFLPREPTADGLAEANDVGGGGDSRLPSPLRMATLEYLYVEEGEFRAASGGPSFHAVRRYVWRYDEAADKISVWFVRIGDNKRADYLFHEIDLVLPGNKEDGGYRGRRDSPAKKQSQQQENVETKKKGEEGQEGQEAEYGDDNNSGCWEATAGHLCVEDFYDVAYQFCFQAVNLGEWGIKYTVKGPKKDYTIDGRYTRLN